MPSAEKPGFRFPSAFTILFALIILVAALTWIIPAGQYERIPSEALGRDVPVAGSFAPADPNPQGFFDIILAPIAGFYDPLEYTANAIDVSLFVLIIGGFIGVVTATGAIDAGIARAMVRLKGRENWMIPFLMALFALGGTTYGMAEETLAFYVLLIPVMIAAKYDALTAVAVILLGAGVGVLGSTINAFSTVIASDAAGVSFADGLLLRLAILVVCWAVTVAFVMRYAARVRADPTRSLVMTGRPRTRRISCGDNRPVRAGRRPFHRAAQDRPDPVRTDLWRDDLGRLHRRLVDGGDERPVPGSGHRHRNLRPAGRGQAGGKLRERRARSSGCGADHRSGARDRRGDGRRPHHRHHPACGGDQRGGFRRPPSSW
jgi:hypothetical protein